MKKKILFVNGHLNVGGVEKSLIDILKNINYDIYDIDLVLFEDLGDYINELPDKVNLKFTNITNTYGSTIKCLKKSLKNKDCFSFWLKTILFLTNKFNQKFIFFAKFLFKFKTKYDCAIAFRVGFCAEVVAHCVNANQKYVWWHHGECNYNNNERYKMANIFNYFDQVVAVSNGCKEMIENYFGNLNNKVIVIPNMIDTDEINKKAIFFNPYENENFNIVTVGRLSPEKNIICIVEIVKELIKSGFYDFRWHIVGNGSEFEKIKIEIEKNKLNNHIILKGEKNNPYPYIKNADIMVHPSLVESQCLTVLEALALSKPCIVSESIGPKEFILNGINGILTSHSPKDIAYEIINLINNEELYNKIELNALKTIESKYSVKNIIGKIENLLDNGGINICQK